MADMGAYIEALDNKQDECYANFLARMGLEHTEATWDAFIDVWVCAMGLGAQMAVDIPFM